MIKQVEVNIDYILMLVEKYHDGNCEDKEILSTIRKAVDASIQLRSKKELIEQFIRQVNVESSVQGDWRRYVSEQEESDLAEIIATEKLKPEETRKFMENAFRDGAIKTTGTDIDKLMPPVSRFRNHALIDCIFILIRQNKRFLRSILGLALRIL